MPHVLLFGHGAPTNLPGAPGAPVLVSAASNTLTVGWSAPTTGSALDQGNYVLQWRPHAGGAFTNVVVPYTTPGLTGFSAGGHNWRIANGTNPGAIFVDNVEDTPTNNVVLMYDVPLPSGGMPANSIWQFGSGQWYIEPDTSTATTNAWTQNGTPTSDPITLGLTISGLSPSTGYDFQVFVTNSQGTSSTTVAAGSFTTTAPPQEALTISPIPTEVIGTAFNVPGTIANVAAPPTLQWNDNNGPWQAWIGPAPTATSFTLNHPAIGSAQVSWTVGVRDASTLVSTTSNSFSVQATAPANNIIWGGFFDQAQQSTSIVSTEQNLISTNWVPAGGSGTPPIFKTCEIYAYGSAGFTLNVNWSTQAGGSGLNGWQVPNQNAVCNAASGGFPMLALGVDMSGTEDQTFTDIRNGLYDVHFDEIFQSFASAGYTKMGIRWLWEFNVGNGMASTTQANYVGAYQHCVARGQTAPARFGITIVNIWNPGAGNGGPTSWYPGDAYVDIITLDQAAGWDQQGNYTTNPQDMSIADYMVGGCAAFAVSRGKPMGMCESGCSAISINDAYSFNSQTNLTAAINNNQTTITVGSNFRFGVGDTLAIDYEWLHITSINGNTIGVTRGWQGTVAAAHNNNAQVSHGGYTQWLSSCLQAINAAGAKVAIWSFYDATDASGSGDPQAYELWHTNAADTAAVVNFMRLAPSA